jgi:hypothetical protein
MTFWVPTWHLASCHRLQLNRRHAKNNALKLDIYIKERFTPWSAWKLDFLLVPHSGSLTSQQRTGFNQRHLRWLAHSMGCQEKALLPTKTPLASPAGCTHAFLFPVFICCHNHSSEKSDVCRATLDPTLPHTSLVLWNKRNEAQVDLIISRIMLGSSSEKLGPKSLPKCDPLGKKKQGTWCHKRARQLSCLHGDHWKFCVNTTIRFQKSVYVPHLKGWTAFVHTITESREQ